MRDASSHYPHLVTLAGDPSGSAGIASPADPDHAAEQWLPIPGHPGYDASSHGRIRSRREHRHRCTVRILKPSTTDRGYLKVNLGRTRQMYVHRLVLLAFTGQPPRPDDHGDHLDWNRTNNRPENLRWLSPVENSVRWNGWDGGRVRWATPDTPPEDLHDYGPVEPLTPDEVEELAQAWAS